MDEEINIKPYRLDEPKVTTYYDKKEDMIYLVMPNKPEFKVDLSFWDKLRVIGIYIETLIKYYPLIISLLKIMNWINKTKQKTGDIIMFKTDLRTTVTGIVGAVAMLVNMFFKLEIPQDAIIAVFMFFIGLFAAQSGTKKA
jgi:hypothetical protein